MTEVILHAGSNIGFREINLELAEVMIGNYIGDILSKSRLYETAAWGVTDQASFLNIAYKVTSTLSATEVLEQIHLIEKKMGREKTKKWGPRLIDVDILFYGEEIIENPNLIIPHPQLTNRSFVLTPLLDICPDKVHPVLNKTIVALKESCSDASKVVVFN